MSRARRTATTTRRVATRVAWSVALTLFVVQTLLTLLLRLDGHFGLQAVAITGPSMTGTFSRGAEVFIDPTDTAQQGDIITFRGDNGTLVTHRIVGQDADGFITKGDHNETADPWRTQTTAVLGVVHGHIPLIGYGEIFLVNPVGRVLTFGPILLLFLCTEIASLTTGTGRGSRSTGNARHRREPSVA